jgi:C4-dicarboxylate-specific signal transduction histidine kinase
MTEPSASLPVSLTKPHRALGMAILLALFLLAGVLTYKVSEKQGFNQLRDEASHQLDILASAIDSEVTRHASIPSAVELSPDIRALLRAPAAKQDVLQAAANRFLQQLNDHLGGPAIFVLDTTGHVVASSDWIFSDNLLGVDLSYMPFFRAAVAGTPERHYAVDSVRNEPGYFFALPIRDELQDWKVIGVAVVKSGLRELERRWLAQEAPALIVDSNGIVLLASPPEWRYATLQPQSRETLARISREQFASQPVGGETLEIAVDAAHEGTVVRLARPAGGALGAFQGKKSYLALSRHLPGTAWRIVVFSDLHPVAVQASTHAALATAAFGCLLLWALYMNQRRRVAHARREAQAMLEKANQELECNVAARTVDLSDAVERLQKEVVERQRAEQTLRAAQDELVQAANSPCSGRWRPASRTNSASRWGRSVPCRPMQSSSCIAVIWRLPKKILASSASFPSRWAASSRRSKPSPASRQQYPRRLMWHRPWLVRCFSSISGCANRMFRSTARSSPIYGSPGATRIACSKCWSI